MKKNENIRQPIQERSIKKKEKIIDAGFELICEKGYHNISTPDIAKKAGVSTGIIYDYFNDKHDILIEGLKKHMDSLFFPMLHIDTNKKIKKENLKRELSSMVKKLIQSHEDFKIAHEKIMAITHSDLEVATYYKELEIKMCNNITEFLINNNFSKNKLKERVHISIGLIENLCHEVVYHEHKELNTSSMIEISLNIILNLFE